MQARLTSPLDERGSERRQLYLGTRVSTAASENTEAWVHNISSTGLLLETASPLALGECIDVNLPEAGQTSVTVVWCSERLYGCTFEQPISTGTISASRLRSSFDQSYGQVASPAAEPEEQHAAEALAQGQLSPRAKLAWICGSALLCWALIGGAAWSLIG